MNNIVIHKVLVCIDFSDYTDMVIEYAATLIINSKIVLYNVINQRDVDTVRIVNRNNLQNKRAEQYINKIKNERISIFKKLIEKKFEKNKENIRIIIDVGIPSLQILKRIDTENADVVLLANKGKDDIPGFLFGSVADKVFKHSPVPVLSVRQ